jgi:hypothetical protein
MNPVNDKKEYCEEENDQYGATYLTLTFSTQANHSRNH